VVIALASLASSVGLAGAGAPAQAADASVTIVDFAFNPSTTTVTVGSTVHWTHTGMAPHTVTADNGFFDSGRLAPGGTFDFTFPRVATYTYKCMIHPDRMTGTITVVASTAAPAATGAAGAGAATGQSVAFKAGVNLVGVPAGTAITPTVVFAFDATTQQYTAIQPGEIKNGKGYWAYFDSAPSVSLAAGVSTPVSVDAPAGIYTTIGNPSGTRPATVTGADAVYTYDASSGQYVATKTLQPGDGAWAISLKGGQITITPSP
jgi:plastocyanin